MGSGVSAEARAATPAATPIFIDVTRLVARLSAARLPTGIDRVGLAYVAHFEHRARALVRWAGRAHLLPRRESAALFRWLQAPAPRLLGYLLVALGSLRAALCATPRAGWLIHPGHGGLDAASYRRLVRRQGWRLLVMIHDLIPLTHPEFCRAGEAPRHAARLRQALSLASGVVCNSAATHTALRRWAAQQNLPVPPVAVAHLGAGLTLKGTRPRPLATPYFVVLGTLEPRKNHALLVAVWPALRAQLGPLTPRLVVVGQPGWLYEQTLKDLRAGAARGDFVLALDACSDAQLVAWIAHAQALLLPSFAEGYGLPLVEALALGVPVIASDLAVFREIAGDHPQYLAPHDVAAWTQAIGAYATLDAAATRAPRPPFVAPTWAAHFAVLAPWLTAPSPPPVYALGFSWWKQAALAAALPGSHVRFVERLALLPPGATVALWGNDPTAPAARPDLVVLRVEDGFLRSVGLGAELTAPLSWVVDRRGLYYDASHPSDLEVCLESADFTPAECARAAQLRAQVVADGLTKYNLAGTSWSRPAHLPRVILVPGQVESDAALRAGAPVIKTNLALMQAVRAAAPAAFIIYKPHPDVVAGLRVDAGAGAQIAALADAVVTNVDLHALFASVDEVHVLTSLTGFEALLRGKAVTCYGLPFYAGWGLTHDIYPLARRTRRRSLDELVAAALLRYPLYFSRATGEQTSPEHALAELRAWRDEAHRRGAPWWRGLWRATLRRVVGVR